MLNKGSKNKILFFILNKSQSVTLVSTFIFSMAFQKYRSVGLGTKKLWAILKSYLWI